MKTITKVVGVDSKAGRRSRTGSTITMGISDLDAIKCQEFFLALQAGEDPTGRLKRIELNLIYEDDINNEIDLPDTKDLDKVLENSGGIESNNHDIDSTGETNQPDLDIYEKEKPQCKHAFINGQCANCGILEVDL